MATIGQFRQDLILSLVTRKQCNYFSGKPGNVGEFEDCLVNVRDFTAKFRETAAEPPRKLRPLVGYKFEYYYYCCYY